MSNLHEDIIGEIVNNFCLLYINPKELFESFKIICPLTLVSKLFLKFVSSYFKCLISNKLRFNTSNVIFRFTGGSYNLSDTSFCCRLLKYHLIHNSNIINDQLSPTITTCIKTLTKTKLISHLIPILNTQYQHLNDNEESKIITIINNIISTKTLHRILFYYDYALIKYPRLVNLFSKIISNNHNTTNNNIKHTIKLIVNRHIHKHSVFILIDNLLRDARWKQKLIEYNFGNKFVKLTIDKPKSYFPDVGCSMYSTGVWYPTPSLNEILNYQRIFFKILKLTTKSYDLKIENYLLNFVLDTKIQSGDNIIIQLEFTPYMVIDIPMHLEYINKYWTNEFITHMVENKLIKPEFIVKFALIINKS